MGHIFCSSHASMKLADFSKKHFLNKRIPLEGGIELTHKCNLRCVHCYGACSRNKKDLSSGELFAIIDQLCELGCLSILFSGGEVLLRKDFLEIYQYVRLKGISVIVLSNATLLKQEHIDAFLEYPIMYFSTTMYGFSKDVFEQITKIKGSHANFLKGIALLKRNRIPFELKSVALANNKHEILDISKFAKRLKVPFRYATYVRAMNDFSVNHMMYRLSPEEAFEFDITDSIRKSFWEKVALEGKSQPFCDARRGNGYKYICHAGEQSFWIQADGTLRICAKEIAEGFSLLTGTFREGWEEFIPSVIDKVLCPDSYPCLTCKYFKFCEQCAADIESEKNFEKLPNIFQCKLARLRYDWCENILSNLSPIYELNNKQGE